MTIALKQTMSGHPMTVRSKDELLSAYIRMKREGYRHMPVVDDSGDLSGIISDRDFQRAMWPMNSPDAHGLPDVPNFRKDAKVGEYMSWPAISLPEDTNLETAIRTMLDKKISAVVVTRGAQIAGIITHEDLLRVLSVLLKGEPNSLKERIVGLTYNSPIGGVADLLSASGI